MYLGIMYFRIDLLGYVIQGGTWVQLMSVFYTEQ